MGYATLCAALVYCYFDLYYRSLRVKVFDNVENGTANDLKLIVCDLDVSVNINYRLSARCTTVFVLLDMLESK
jgi:hypothetical protein